MFLFPAYTGGQGNQHRFASGRRNTFDTIPIILIAISNIMLKSLLATKYFTLPILLCTWNWVAASIISNQPVVAYEPGLESSQHSLLNNIGWIDDDNLLVSANRDSPFRAWEQKLVAINVRKREVKVLLPKGALICTNASYGIVSARSDSDPGSPDGRLHKLFAWDPKTSTLIETNEAADWNSSICQKTLSSQINEVNTHQHGIAYLDFPDGYLKKNGPDGADLIRDNKTVAKVSVSWNMVSEKIEYMKYRKEYLLSPGYIYMAGGVSGSNTKSLKEVPVITMTKSGEIHREFMQPIFGTTKEATTVPYARGMLTFRPGTPQDGGGAYLVQSKSVKRIWCSDVGNRHDRQCEAMPLAISPDGCHAAFFALGSDEPKAQLTSNPTLKILPLCAATID